MDFLKAWILPVLPAAAVTIGLLYVLRRFLKISI